MQHKLSYIKLELFTGLNCLKHGGKRKIGIMEGNKKE